MRRWASKMKACSSPTLARTVSLSATRSPRVSATAAREPLELLLDAVGRDVFLARREEDPAGQDGLGPGRSPAKRRSPRKRMNSMAGYSFSPNRLSISSARAGPGRGLVRAVDPEDDVRPLGRGQGQDAEDALAVDLAAVLDDPDVGPEAVGRVDELDRRPGVQAELVLDGDGSFEHAAAQDGLRAEEGAGQVDVLLALLDDLAGHVLEACSSAGARRT